MRKLRCHHRWARDRRSALEDTAFNGQYFDEDFFAYREDADLTAALRERWGEAVFADGEVDRAAVGRIVFAEREELDWLERQLHPRVVREYRRWQNRYWREELPEDLRFEPYTPPVCPWIAVAS